MRIGSITYATVQGLGIQVKQFYDHGIIDEVMIYKHRCYDNHYDWYPPETPVITERPIRGQAEGFLNRIDVLVQFETFFDWTLLMHCRAKGVKTVLVPHYECMPEKLKEQPDKIICPSLLDEEYYPGNPVLPIPVDYPWKQRTKALRFLHNGGNLGLRGRNGTLEILQAMQYVQSPVEVMVRCQDAAGIAAILRKLPKPESDRFKIHIGTVPYEKLFEDYDVYLSAEKFSGSSLALQEACAAGMLVITTDRFPQNTWLPRKPLIPYHNSQKVRVMGDCLEIDEAIVDPKDIAASIDKWYGKDITAISRSGKIWAGLNSWDVLGPAWRKEIESA